MVHNAYKYVMSQLSEINRVVTVEDLESQFEAFCSLQENEPPPLMEIRDSDDKMQAFHRAFETLPRGNTEGHAMRASMTGGYDRFMQVSEYGQPDSHEATGPLGGIEFETELVTYVEPERTGTDTRLTFSETDQADEMDDYGTDNPFQMTDYRTAFSTPRQHLHEVGDRKPSRACEDEVNES